MKFIETDIKGVYIIELLPVIDERGFFCRTFCKNEFSSLGLETNYVQCNTSRSIMQYTLRGMHFQINDSQEVKLVRCCRGSVQDVVIDLRPDSISYCKYISIELSEINNKMLYIPRGFAHGFLTLEPNCEITYMVSDFYSSKNERGVRWDDPLFAVKWRNHPVVLSKKDSLHPNYIMQK